MIFKAIKTPLIKVGRPTSCPMNVNSSIRFSTSSTSIVPLHHRRPYSNGTCSHCRTDKLSMRFFCISRKLSEQNLPTLVAAHPLISVLLTERNLTETLALDIYGSGSFDSHGGC